LACLLVVVALPWSLALPQACAVGVPIFWVEGGANGRLGRVNSDGTGYQVLLTGLFSPTGVDVDPINGHVYWTEPSGPNTGRIRRADLNGANPTDVVTGLAAPAGISLDFSQSKIYWTNASYDPSNSNTNPIQPTVQRSDFNGSNVETLISGPNAIAIEVDPIGGKIYFPTGHNTNAIALQTANLDGSNVQPIYNAAVSSTGSEQINGVTVGYGFDNPSGRVFFTRQGVSSGPSTVESMALTGGLTTTIDSNSPSFPFYGVDYHPGYERVVAAAIYGSQGSGEITWTKTDGSFFQLISTVGAGLQVNDVAIWPYMPTIPEPTAAVLGAAALLAIRLQRHRHN
jgi:hypothetical protein